MAALRHLVLDPDFLHCVQSIGLTDSFERHDRDTTALTGIEHERTIAPPTWTVQAPQ